MPESESGTSVSSACTSAPGPASKAGSIDAITSHRRWRIEKLVLSDTPHPAAAPRSVAPASMSSAQRAHVAAGSLVVPSTRPVDARKLRPHPRQSLLCAPSASRPLLTVRGQPHLGHAAGGSSSAPAGISPATASSSSPSISSRSSGRIALTIAPYPNLSSTDPPIFRFPTTRGYGTVRTEMQLAG